LTAETLRFQKVQLSVQTLQWGRRFLTAETAEGFRTGNWSCFASMGPPFFDGGNFLPHCHHLQIDLASMGPPFFDGGNLPVVSFALVMPLIASMGPPFFDGGNGRESCGGWAW